MTAVQFLLNLIWIVFGGIWMALGWVIAGIIMAITIIGIPWARAVLQHRALHVAAVRLQGGVAGRNISARRISALGRSASSATSSGSCWPAGGWRSSHLVLAIVFAITIIGIPFAWAHFKLAALALWPIGKMIVPIDVGPLPYPRRD